MRVLFVTPFYHPERKFGGPPSKIHSLASRLRSSKCKVEVKVVTFDHADCERCTEAELENVPVQYLPWAGKGLKQWPRHRRKLLQVVADSDVIHCFGIYNLVCPFAVREAVRHRKPFGIEPLGMYPPRARNQFAKRLYNETVTKWMFRKASAIIATSEAEARELQEIAPAQKIYSRGNGIEVLKFHPLPAGNSLRERWGVSDDEKLVVFIGRLSPIKNLEQLISAFAQLKRGDRNLEAGVGNARYVKLVLVGPAEEDYESRLRSLVVANRIENAVVFAGPLYDDDQKAALDAADLFVLPSVNESFGNAAGEAVAANVPVLLTDTCGIAAIIHQRAGFAVPLGIESLANGLRVMLDDAKSSEFTARRDEVKAQLSWNEPVARQIVIYDQLIRSASTR